MIRNQHLPYPPAVVKPAIIRDQKQLQMRWKLLKKGAREMLVLCGAFMIETA
jgi:hypothetical protein